MSTPRWRLGVGVGDGLVCAVGGRNSSDDYLSSVECYDPSTNTFALKSPLLNARESHAVVAMEDKYLYAIGGYNEAVLKSCEKYSFEENEWVSISNLIVARYDPAAANLNGVIYAMGGWNDEYKNDVECYSPSTDQWKVVASLGVARDALRAAVVNHRLYAVGGAYSKVVEVYNEDENTWAREADLTTARSYLAVVAV